MHLLANPVSEPGYTALAGGSKGQEEREAVPLEREVVAQVVDALFNRCGQSGVWMGSRLERQVAWVVAGMAGI